MTLRPLVRDHQQFARLLARWMPFALMFLALAPSITNGALCSTTFSSTCNSRSGCYWCPLSKSCLSNAMSCVECAATTDETICTNDLEGADAVWRFGAALTHLMLNSQVATGVSLLSLASPTQTMPAVPVWHAATFHQSSRAALPWPASRGATRPARANSIINCTAFSGASGAKQRAAKTATTRCALRVATGTLVRRCARTHYIRAVVGVCLTSLRRVRLQCTLAVGVRPTTTAPPSMIRRAFSAKTWLTRLRVAVRIIASRVPNAHARAGRVCIQTIHRRASGVTWRAA